MPTQIGSLVRALNRRPNDHLNILTYCTHERYSSAMAGINATFWLAQGVEGVKAGWREDYAPLPANHILLDGKRGASQLPEGVDFDFVFCQSNTHWHISKTLADQFQIPIVKLEHTQPSPEWTELYRSQLRQLRGKVNVFISEFSRREWGWKDDEATVIHHGVDTALFVPEVCERQNVLLSVVNDWVNRDHWCGFYLWKEATQGLPVRVLGDTPGLSKAAANVEELVQAYQTSSIFLNTSLVSPIPTVLLEGAASGCACVSTATGAIPEFFTHGEDILFGKDAAELRQHCERLLKDQPLREKLGRAARQTIEKKFSLEKFAANWERVFRSALV